MNVTSDRLKKLRMSQGYTKSDIAREMGVTRRAVYAWEEADKLPEISSSYAQAVCFGILLRDNG